MRLDPSRVPAELRPLIPLAERFGVSDDYDRAKLLQRTPAADLAAARAAVDRHMDAFDDWLAGPEAAGESFSAEYIAFSCLRIGVWDES